jgi:hypothetical protein
MFNSPYAKGGMQTNGPAKPEYASGGDLNTNPGGMSQQAPWNPWSFNGYMGAGSNSSYNEPVGGGFTQQPLTQGAPSVGQPGQATNAPNPSVPAGPTMPRFQTGTTIGNGADNPRRFMQRPSLSPQQMQQLTRGGQRPPANAYTPGDGYIELPPGPVGY